MPEPAAVTPEENIIEVRGLRKAFDGVPVLDLDYAEDSACDTDMNVVMTGSGGFVEVQGTAEGVPFSRAQLDAMTQLAERGIAQLVTMQRQALDLA